MRLSLFCLTCLMVQIVIAQEEENAAPPEIASEATPELFRDAEAGFGLRLAGGFGFLCFILLVATTPQAWPRLAPVAQRIVEGIALFTPEVPAIDPQLRAYFAGSRLNFYFSRTSRDTSFQGTERIYLCGDGSFFHGEQTQASFDVPQAMRYSRTGDNSSGKWSVNRTPSGALLTLPFHDGRPCLYQATRLGSEVLYLNGSKYFRSGHTRCQYPSPITGFVRM